MAGSASTGLPSNLDQFLNMDAFNDPQPVIAGEDDTAGMSFAEVFRHYLAPEVAKLPSSFLPSLPALPALPMDDARPFAVDAPELSSPQDSYPLSAFAPFALPGSPVGGFSPSSASGADGSPLSFGDMDDTPDWSIDPTVLGGGPSLDSTLPFFPDLAALPPLPALPEIEDDIVIKSEPAALTSFPTRSVSASIAEEDEHMAESESDAESDEEPGSKRGKKSTRSKRGTSASSNGKKPKTSVSAFASATLHATSSRSTLPPVPEWADKPDPESYKKLDSKEKRQLRNKISARNFRHRRKEYITTLEEEISSRDTIIDQLRDEVGGMRAENKSLHGEVDMLKTKWEEMMAKMTSFQPAPVTVGLGLNAGQLVTPPADDSWALDSPKPVEAELPPVASTSTAPAVTRKRANEIAKPNLQKDVAPGLARRSGSWTTAPGMGGGYMPVHTTMLPDFNLGVKPSLSPFAAQSFNPALNNLTPAQLSQLPSLTAHLRTGFAPPAPDATMPTPAPARTGTFESFFESNPYWLKPEHVEEYRSQLYGKMANNLAGTAAASKASSTSPPSSHLPLPTGFRPAFFTSPKPPRDSDPTSDLLAFQSPREASARQQQQTAYVASLATQTLFSRMAGAFVDAFAGAEGKGLMSPDKVAEVLAGRSALRVVPNDDLATRMGGMAIEDKAPTSPPPASCSFEAVVNKAWRGKAEGKPKPAA